jgi:hypothetical protein
MSCIVFVDLRRFCPRAGLKLQGDIGKFGNVELSDVAAYVEVPNGKIIAGTETGTLLLWDGNLIQVSWRARARRILKYCCCLVSICALCVVHSLAIFKIRISFLYWSLFSNSPSLSFRARTACRAMRA